MWTALHRLTALRAYGVASQGKKKFGSLDPQGNQFQDAQGRYPLRVFLFVTAVWRDREQSKRAFTRLRRLPCFLKLAR